MVTSGKFRPFVSVSDFDERFFFTFVSGLPSLYDIYSTNLVFPQPVGERLPSLTFDLVYDLLLDLPGP